MLQSMNKFLVSFLFLSLSSCAHYQSSIGNYRGPGENHRSPAQRHYVSSGSGEFQLAWPVENIQISQNYRPRRNRKHQGVDLRGARGTKILAAHRGRVIYTGNGFRGYGKMVMIEHGSKWASLYAHLNRIDVRQGDYVEMGEVIGRMGRTGRATGVHLHFELLKNKLPIDPLHYLPDASRIAGN